MKYKVIRKYVYSDVVHVYAANKEDAENIAISIDDDEAELMNDDMLLECVVSEEEE